VTAYTVPKQFFLLHLKVLSLKLFIIKTSLQYLHVLSDYEAKWWRIRIEHYRSEDLLKGYLAVSFENTAAF
jgi:hypothetical protein